VRTCFLGFFFLIKVSPSSSDVWLPKAFVSFGYFLWRLPCGATWACFESGPTQPFCDFVPFRSRTANSGIDFLPLLYMAGVV
jgi:hypothetical protein